MKQMTTEEMEKLERDMNEYVESSYDNYMKIVVHEDTTQEFQNIVVDIYTNAFDDSFNFFADAFDTFENVEDYCQSKIDMIVG